MSRVIHSLWPWTPDGGTATQAPAAPSGLTGAMFATSADLTWTDNSVAPDNATSFTYEWKKSADPSYTTGTSAITAATVTGLDEDTNYDFRVKANNAIGSSGYASVGAQLTPLKAPTGLSVNITGTTADLSWTDTSSAEHGFRIERSLNGGSYTLVTTTAANATSYSDTGLAAGTYVYRVRSQKTSGNFNTSLWLNQTGSSTVVTAPSAPSGLTATATSSTAISLSWTDNANNEDGFKVERSTDNTNWTEIAGNLAANTTSYSATGLTASTLYYFRVRAYNTGGNSAYTSSASATTQSGGLSPAWSIDWSSGTPSGYTLTRASTGTYVDSSGYIASAATDVARLTHNSSGSRLGLLVEEQRTNLLLRSEDFGNATWNKYQSTVTANSVAAPDNATTADSLMEDATNNSHLLYQDVASLSQDVDQTFSVFLKKGGRNHVAIYMNAGSIAYRRVMVDLTNGTVSDSGSASGFAPVSASQSVEDFGNGWYRVRMTMKASNSSGTQTYQSVIATSDRSTFTGTLQFAAGYPQYSGNTGIVGVYAWGAQLETASTATSYIPTTTASVTRSADLAHVLDSSITSWGDPGALVVHFYPPGQAGTLISTDDASTAQVGIEASTTTAARAFWSSGSTATGTIGSGVQKAVHYWTGSTSKFCINGGTVQSGTNNLTIGNTDFVTLGAEATDSAGVPGTFSQYANCVIRKVEFYSGTLTDANLQTITT